MPTFEMSAFAAAMGTDGSAPLVGGHIGDLNVTAFAVYKSQILRRSQSAPFRIEAISDNMVVIACQSPIMVHDAETGAALDYREWNIDKNHHWFRYDFRPGPGDLEDFRLFRLLVLYLAISKLSLCLPVLRRQVARDPEAIAALHDLQQFADPDRVSA